MWRFKRKRDTSGAITKYKACWVIIGNHQIRGIDYFDAYASVGVKESLNTLYAMAASDDLEMESFNIITASLTGTMDVPVHSVQVKGFIHLSQESYLQSVLDRFGMEHVNAVSTPLLHSTRLAPASADDAAAWSEFPYREIVGCLNHAAVNTRPDISHAVSQLTQHSSSYGLIHITAAKHLLRYIKGTLDRGLIFRQHPVDSCLLTGYADADYANDVSTRRSTTGYTITVGG